NIFIRENAAILYDKIFFFIFFLCHDGPPWLSTLWFESRCETPGMGAYNIFNRIILSRQCLI
ncbi:MAG: hypothetical protein PVJ88_07425, partial [Desulfobacterales bacterium]